MQVICRVKAPFSLCGDREEFAIAKKLQRCRDFCFRDGRIVPTGRFHDGWIVSTDGYRKGGVTATGQIAQTCVFSAAARAATSRATDRTKRPRGLAGSGWAAARVQRGLLRIGRSGALGLVSSDGAASLGLEPTGGGGRGSGSPEESGVPVPTAAAKLAARGSLMQNLVRDIGFWAGLGAHWAFRFAFPQSARREFRVGLAQQEFCVCLVRRDFCIGLARREVKNFMLWAEPPARQTESVQT